MSVGKYLVSRVRLSRSGCSCQRLRVSPVREVWASISYLASGFLEVDAVLVSGADRKLHKGALVTLNALLARSRFFFF